MGGQAPNCIERMINVLFFQTLVGCQKTYTYRADPDQTASEEAV